MLVSKLGLGGAALGTKIYTDMNRKTGVEIVKKAFQLGINWVDVSPYYGITKAEETLGHALLELNIPRESYYIATKCGRYGEKDFDFSPARITSSIDESLKRLNLDYVDLLQCHDIEFADLDFILNETLPALRKLKESGKVKNIGITGYPLKIFKYILEKDEENVVDTVLSYCHYSLNNSSLEEIIPFLQEKQVGIINAGALSMGLLTSGGPPSWHPASEELKRLCREAANYCKSKGTSIEKIGLQFALQNPNIHTTLIGSSSISEIENSVKWYEELEENGLDKKLVHELQEILKPELNKSWTTGKMENN